MSSGLINSIYLAAAILFILALGGLSSNENAKRGNLYGMLGMALAVIATVFSDVVTSYWIIIACMSPSQPRFTLSRWSVWPRSASAMRPTSTRSCITKGWKKPSMTWRSILEFISVA